MCFYIYFFHISALFSFFIYIYILIILIMAANSKFELPVH